MARVNLEERCFAEVSRLNALGIALGSNEAEALGILSFIWFESQSKLLTKVTKSQLVAFSRVVRPDRAEKFVQAFCDPELGYGTLQDDVIELHGNLDQISAYVNMLDGSKKGGAATKERWARLSGEGPGHSPRRSDLKAHPRPNSSQVNPSQVNPSQAISSPPNPQTGEILDQNNQPKKLFPAPKELVELWNSNCGDLPKVNPKRLGNREAKARTRLREEPDLAVWESAIKKIALWPFGLGNNDTGWKANFSYLLQPETLAKAEEGFFDSKAKTDFQKKKNRGWEVSTYQPEAEFSWGDKVVGENK